GIERQLPRWKILRHVLEHSTMHGGQIIGMFRMLGHQPPASSPMIFISRANLMPLQDRGAEGTVLAKSWFSWMRYLSG
ncbi:MAG: DinB family protein, partial [Candidatus Sulfotelmatobacter sp.]